MAESNRMNPLHSRVRGLFPVVRGAAVFLTLFLVALFALFGAGSLHLYQDATLLFILAAASLTSRCLMTVAAVYLGMAVFLAATEKNATFLLNLILGIFSLAAALGAAFFSRALRIFSAGGGIV